MFEPMRFVLILLLEETIEYIMEFQTLLLQTLYTKQQWS